MVTRYYNGVIGEFSYNDDEFMLDSEDGHLRYIGNLSNGSDIKIPDGIKDCRYMFQGCKCLIYPPVLPEGVENCNFMFHTCENLVQSPEIPDSVMHCSFMFFGCQSLEKAPVVPDNVRDCRGMFLGCNKLTTVAYVPKRALTCVSMFENCFALKDVSSLVIGAKRCESMFYGCTLLENPPVLVNGIKDCSSMFYGCKSLKQIPVIPDSVIAYDQIVFNCPNGLKIPFFWNVNHRGESFYDELSSLSVYYPESVLCKCYEDAGLMPFLRDVVDRHEGSDNDVLYAHFIEDIGRRDNFDVEELSSQLHILDKAYDVRKQRMDDVRFCKMPNCNEYLREDLSVNSGYEDSCEFDFSFFQ